MLLLAENLWFMVSVELAERLRAETTDFDDLPEF